MPFDDVEDGARALLRRRQPAAQFVALVRAIISDLRAMRRAEAESSKRTLGAQIREIDGQTERLLDRIVEGNGTATVLAAFEDRVETMERQKISLSGQAAGIVPAQERLKEVIEPALAFLSGPWKICENVSLPLNTTVMKLAFTQPLRYHRKEGYRTAEIAFPRCQAVLRQQSAVWWATLESNQAWVSPADLQSAAAPCSASPDRRAVARQWAAHYLRAGEASTGKSLAGRGRDTHCPCVPAGERAWRRSRHG